VITSPLYRRLSLWLISLLMGLLALGPFLHAHYGASWMTGFHLSGLPASARVALPITGAEANPNVPVLSPSHEEESPAVGVAPSMPRGSGSGSGARAGAGSGAGDDPSDSEADAHTVSAHWVLMFGPSALLMPYLGHLLGSFAVGADTLKPPSIFKAGWPPPAHAPPFSR